MNGKNRPSREYRPFPLERLELKRYSSRCNFGASLWWVIRIFDDFSQNSSKFYFHPKIQFQVVWGAPNPNFALQIGENGSSFGGSFDRGWKTFRGPSIPENMEKIQQEMREKLGAQFWGFKLLMTPALSSTGKTLDADNENLLFRHVHFLPILQASG